SLALAEGERSLARARRRRPEAVIGRAIAEGLYARTQSTILALFCNRSSLAQGATARRGFAVPWVRFSTTHQRPVAARSLERVLRARLPTRSHDARADRPSRTAAIRSSRRSGYRTSARRDRPRPRRASSVASTRRAVHVHARSDPRPLARRQRGSRCKAPRNGTNEGGSPSIGRRSRECATDNDADSAPAVKRHRARNRPVGGTV